MACMFPPGPPDLPAFWAHVLDGTDAVTEVPPARWDPGLHHGPPTPPPTTSPSPNGAASSPKSPSTPLRYGIPPASLASIEPIQLLALEAARRALADAGYDGRDFPRDRTCVIFGAEAGSDTANATTLRTVLPSYLGWLPEELAAQLPTLTEDSFPGMLANVISGRIANRLDLGGANYTVDAACASSLTALDAACKELLTGAADVALCGGADLHNGINDYLLFSSVHALSPTGRCRPFAADADGIALGEGVACVVLKRLADAERDGDRVYAVVKGVGSASDGRSLGLTAPRPEGQRAALERAYAQAGISPADVGLVEAHGTGTVVGDRTELATLSAVFEAAGAPVGGCVVGSVKSQIGHTKCAADLAGLIKTALALHTGVRPPTLHVDRPNPAWRPEDSPFVFHDKALPWPAPAGRRAAGVSAFGFGGTNFHVVLGAHEYALPPRHGHDAWPAELLLFASPGEAAEMLDLAELNDRSGRPWRLRDLALTAARRTGTHRIAAAVVAGSLDALPDLLRAAAAGEPCAGVFLAENGDIAPGKIAFLFPGQGSQRAGMLAELFTAFPETQRHLHRAPAAALFPPTAFDDGTRQAQHARITDTRSAQPALGAVCLAAYDVLTAAGVRPDMAAQPLVRRADRPVRRGRPHPGRAHGTQRRTGPCHHRGGGRRPGNHGRGPRGRDRGRDGARRGRPGGPRGHRQPQRTRPDRHLGPHRRRGRGARRPGGGGPDGPAPARGLRLPQPRRRRCGPAVRQGAGGPPARRPRHPRVVQPDGRPLPVRAGGDPPPSRRADRLPGAVRRAGRGDVRGRCADLRRGRARHGPHRSGGADPR
ncbi:hypothetical protein GCM10020000_73850 [Streptomyces olivoverticillatus]